jgi:hypothetical protein
MGLRDTIRSHDAVVISSRQTRILRMAEITPLPADLVKEIRDLQATAAAALSIDETAKPADIVGRITEYVRGLKESGETLPDDKIIALGVLLGEQYVRAFNWHWGQVVWDFDEDTSGTCVLPSDNSLSINPIWWVNNTVSNAQSTTFMLNFNMVAANKVPPANPNDALGFH